jgi:spore germination protein YaaH
MKKRQIVIELIYEYILLNQNRPREEVENYAKQFRATYEEIEEAIYKASLKTGSSVKPVQKKASFPSLMPLLNPLSYPLPLKIGATTGMLMIVSSVAFFVFNKPEKVINPAPNHTFATQNTKTAQESDNAPLGPREIYSYEKIVDAKTVFSYPASQISLTFSGTPKKETLGFFPYWMLDQQDKISLEGFTAISLFALESDAYGNIVTANEAGEVEPGWGMWKDPDLDKLIQKARSKRIKVYLTIKSFINSDIENISRSDEAQRRLIANSIQLMNSKNLDGINIDFEYRGIASDDVVDGFARFMANLSNELKRQKPKSHLSVDTYLSSASSREFFDISLIKDYVDAIVVMGYDVSTPNTPPGPVAPMEGGNGVMGYMQSYLERVPPEKLILAVAHYGYDWPVSSTGKAGILPYAVIAAQSKSYQIHWNDTWQTPYYQYVDEQGIRREVHFENTRSLGIKFDYIKIRDLKGVGIWAIGYEGNNMELRQLMLEKFTR